MWYNFGLCFTIEIRRPLCGTGVWVDRAAYHPAAPPQTKTASLSILPAAGFWSEPMTFSCERPLLFWDEPDELKKKKKTISLTNATRQRRVCLTIPRFEVLGSGLPVSSFSALCLCGISPASPDFYSIAKTSMLGKLKTPNCPKLGISVWMVVCRYVPCDWLATNPGSPPSLAQSQLR